MNPSQPEVTAILAIHETEGNREWLKQALASLPVGMPYLIVENTGDVSQARNDGIQAAETEYVLLMDADDYWERDALAPMWTAVQNADVVYPSVVHCDQDTLKPYEYVPAAAFCPVRLQEWNYIPGCALARRSAILNVGGYRDMPLLEDWDLWVRLMRDGARFTPCEESVYRYRQVKGSRNDQDFDATHYHQLIVGEYREPVATFYHGDSAAQTYYRCQVPARDLHAIVRKDQNIFTDTGDFPAHKGAAIWSYPGLGTQAVAMAMMQEQGIRVLVEVDDNYLRMPPGGGHWVKKLSRDRPSVAAHRKIVPWADGIITATEYLAEQYRRVNDNVFVCPNQLEPRDWPTDPERQDGPTRIGFAGGAQHLRDMWLAMPGIRWALENGCELVINGLLPTNTKGQPIIPKWLDGTPFTWLPWTNDLRSYRKNLELFDIGLAPLDDRHDWTKGKSDLKALEYLAVGALPILSDAVPYKDWHGRLPMAGDATGFREQVKWAVKNPDAARDMMLEQREYVLEERTVQANLWRWQEAVEAPVLAAA